MSYFIISTSSSGKKTYATTCPIRRNAIEFTDSIKEAEKFGKCEADEIVSYLSRYNYNIKLEEKLS